MFNDMKRDFDSEKEKRVVNMYESGRYINTIQDEVGVSPNKMYSILEKYGIKKRNESGKNKMDYLDKFPDYVIEMIEELYQDESNKVSDILETLEDVNRHQFYKIIKLLGLEHRRPQGEEKEDEKEEVTKVKGQIGGVKIPTKFDKDIEIESISVEDGELELTQANMKIKMSGNIEIQFK